MISGRCKRCGCQIFRDKNGVWIDNSGGDICGIEGGNEPHSDELDYDYIIMSTFERDDESDALLYWNNEHGWVDRESATVFTKYEKENFAIPFDAVWEEIDLKQIVNKERS